MSWKILQGNVFDRLKDVKPESVDAVVTSPPYWRLRSYLPQDHPDKHLEIGSEPTPGDYVENMVRVFRLVRDCLADHGTVWLNVGDTYSSGGGDTPGNNNKGNTANRGSRNRGIPDGNLCLIPQRLMISLQDDGWIVRSVIVWQKPAPMPQSMTGWRWIRCRVKVKNGEVSRHLTNRTLEQVTALTTSGNGAAGAQWQDCPGCKKCEPNGGYVLRKGSWRPTSSWEPIIMLAKDSKYFCDGDAVKTPPAASTVSRDKYTRILDDPDEQFAVWHDHETVCDGANLRDVWKIASESLKQAHYAAFPSELVFRCLSAATSQNGYCPSCGMPWVRVVETRGVNAKRNGKTAEKIAIGLRTALGSAEHNTPETKTLSWRPSCLCIGADCMTPRPGLVLDPFSGSGRVGVQCQRMGLDFVGVELNQEYVDMATEILSDTMPLFNGDG